jgi:hypothetical protein
MFHIGAVELIMLMRNPDNLITVVLINGIRIMAKSLHFLCWENWKVLTGLVRDREGLGARAFGCWSIVEARTASLLNGSEWIGATCFRMPRQYSILYEEGSKWSIA